MTALKQLLVDNNRLTRLLADKFCSSDNNSSNEQQQHETNINCNVNGSNNNDSNTSETTSDVNNNGSNNESTVKADSSNDSNNNSDSEECHLGRLKSLEVLSLSHNHLTHLPDELSQLTTLQKLNLNDNQLEELPVSLTRCVGEKRERKSETQREKRMGERGDRRGQTMCDSRIVVFLTLFLLFSVIDGITEFEVCRNAFVDLPPEVLHAVLNRYITSQGKFFWNCSLPDL